MPNYLVISVHAVEPEWYADYVTADNSGDAKRLAQDARGSVDGLVYTSEQLRDMAFSLDLDEVYVVPTE